MRLLPSRSWSAPTGEWVASRPDPFLLYPAAWPAPEDDLFGAEAVHRQLRRWLAMVGQTAYDDPVDAEAPPGPAL